MGDLARPVGLILAVGVVGAAGDESEVAAVRVLAAEAVAAAVGGKLCRRADRTSGRRDRAMQRVDRRAVRHVEHDADERRPRPRCRPRMWW